MEKHGVISVIVPVYGVEKYLERCIESIIGQTYRELEIILVDDGSPDRCGEICDRYARMDSRVIVIHKENGGAASARNAALRIATGDYLAFIDGDDYLEPDTYAQQAAAALEYGADIVQGRLRYVYTNGAELHNGPGEVLCFTAAEYLVRFTTDWTCAICADKLFRRHVLSQIFFEEGHLIDDEFFTYRGVMNAGKVVYLPTAIYNYRQRASSVMKIRATAAKKVDDTFDYLGKRYTHVTGRFPELKDLYEGHYADHLLWLTTSDLATKETVRAIKEKLLAHMTGGKVVPWKKGHRKRGLKILSTLLTPTQVILNRQKERIHDSGHELFD